VINYFVNRQLSREVIRNTQYISQSEAIIRNSNLINKEIIEMQSGFRGFLLTDQDVFLEPYYSGLTSVPELMSQQRAILENDIQKHRLNSIDQLHRKWTEYADSLIITKRDTLPESVKRYKRLFNTKLRMEVGKKMNDQINTLFAVFDLYEYRVRQQRRAQLENSIQRTGVITLGLTLSLITLSLLLSFYLIRSISGRITKMVDFAERISLGNFITIENKENDELAKLIKSLNKMSETLSKNFQDLTRKNNELDQFAYVVSHDLKAPLRGISNIISWIEEDHQDELTDDVRYNLYLIKGRTQRLENMINGLLQYAKIGKIRGEAERIDTDVLVKELCAILVPPNFELSIESKLPIVDTEKMKIEQIFSNLISNAVKYNKSEKPKITIGFRDMKTHFEFFVSDNGIGIEKQYHEKIFMIFQTLQERDAFESTGVGLAIVKKIIEENKEKIEVHSEPGKGTTFCFTCSKN
jgi:signal transduction histidine kinase